VMSSNHEVLSLVPQSASETQFSLPGKELHYKKQRNIAIFFTLLTSAAAVCGFFTNNYGTRIQLKSQNLEALTTAGNKYAPTFNTDFPGNDIAYWRGPFAGCASVCDIVPTCVAYTLHKDNGANCWLKSHLGNPVPNVIRDTFQVLKENPRSYTPRINTDYPGNDITYWRGPFSGCAKACDSTPNCVAYVIHKDNGANCWLKSLLSNPVPNVARDTFQVLKENTRSYTPLINTDFPGYDITYWRGPFSGCAKACDSTPNCVAYVIHKDNGANCWLKGILGNPLPSVVRDTFRVFKENSRSYTPRANTDFPGNDIKYWRGPFVGCAEACDTTLNCVAYTLHKDYGANCWLKSLLGKPVPNVARDTFQVLK